jgi:hypothetical protein
LSIISKPAVGATGWNSQVDALIDAANGLAQSTKTANYTLALADAGTVVEMNSSSARTVTIPINSSVAFPVGTVIEVQRLGTGLVAIVPTGGVTLHSPAGVAARAQYSSILLRKRATDEWVVAGDVVDRNVDPAWMVGMVSNADITVEAFRAIDLGCPTLRVEFYYTDTVASLKPVIDECVQLGIRPQISAAWDNGISVPDLSNLVNWATAFGPGGSNWPGGSSPYALLNIELGNENSFGYKSGTWNTGGYATIAQSYGSRVLALQNALIATGTAVKTLVELEDGSSGSANWINNVVIGGSTAIFTNMAGPTVHAYGPDWETKVNRVAGFLATAGSTKPYYVTETGISTDNGTTLDDNYGYALNVTYEQAAVDLTSTVTGMQANSHVRQVMLYQVSDQAAPGATTGRESYFGAVQQDGSGKGGLTTAVRQLLSSSYNDAYSL